MAGSANDGRRRRREGNRGIIAVSPRHEREAGKERLPWFAIYTGEMLSETRGWPLVARGAYYELLGAQWDLGVLPREPAKLRGVIRATADEWRIAWRSVESKFPIVAGGRQHPMLEERRQRASDKRSKHRAGAALTNASRWGAEPSTEPTAAPIAKRVAKRVGKRAAERVASSSSSSSSSNSSTREKKKNVRHARSASQKQRTASRKAGRSKANVRNVSVPPPTPSSAGAPSRPPASSATKHTMREGFALTDEERAYATSTSSITSSRRADAEHEEQKYVAFYRAGKGSTFEASDEEWHGERWQKWIDKGLKNGRVKMLDDADATDEPKEVPLHRRTADEHNAELERQLDGRSLKIL